MTCDPCSKGQHTYCHAPRMTAVGWGCCSDTCRVSQPNQPHYGDGGRVCEGGCSFCSVAEGVRHG